MVAEELVVVNVWSLFVVAVVVVGVVIPIVSDVVVVADVVVIDEVSATFGVASSKAPELEVIKPPPFEESSMTQDAAAP